MRLAFLMLMICCLPARAGWRKAAPEPCEDLYKKIYGFTPREKAEYERNGGDFFRIPRKVLPQEVDETNLATLKEMRHEPVVQVVGTRRVAELTEEETQKLFDEIMQIPEVKHTALCKQDRYKDSDRQGFCFARGVAAHLATLQTPLHKKSIRKVWGIGRLEMGDEEWKFHMTTAVRVKGKGWYAIDPSFEKPMPLEDWYKLMRKDYDREKTMRLYSTPAKLFGPTSSGQYSHEKFNREVYNNFFPDLLKSIRAHNRHKGELRDLQEEIREERNMRKLWMAGGFAGALTAAGAYELYQFYQHYKK